MKTVLILTFMTLTPAGNEGVGSAMLVHKFASEKACLAARDAWLAEPLRYRRPTGESVTPPVVRSAICVANAN